MADRRSLQKWAMSAVCMSYFFFFIEIHCWNRNDLHLNCLQSECCLYTTPIASPPLTCNFSTTRPTTTPIVFPLHSLPTEFQGKSFMALWSFIHRLVSIYLLPSDSALPTVTAVIHTESIADKWGAHRRCAWPINMHHTCCLCSIQRCIPLLQEERWLHTIFVFCYRISKETALW